MHVEGGIGYVQPSVEWSNSPMPSGGSNNPHDELTSTMYQFGTSNTGVPSGYVNAISTDSYAIKAPYATFGLGQPFADGQKLNVSVIVSVYIYLSNGVTTGSLHKTMDWGEDRLSTETTDPDWCYLGSIKLSGFAQLTIYIASNVTWHVSVQNLVHGYGSVEIDSFTYLPPFGMNRTYTIDARYYFITLSAPSAKPWYLYGGFYVTS